MSQQSKAEPKELEQAFHTFNKLSLQLTESYRDLETHVSDLNKELQIAQTDHYRELKEKERIANRLQSLLSVLPGGIVVLDGKGIVQEYNRVALELLGKPLGKASWYDVIQRAFAPKFDDGHEVSLTNGRRVTISTCPLESEPGQILLLTEVTEMRRLQDRLSQHQRLASMGQMATSLAHQIRTPLSSALLYASNLKRQSLNEQDRTRFSKKIVKKLGQLEGLVNDMLLYAKSGTMGEEEFSVNFLLKELLQSVEIQLDSTKSKLNYTRNDKEFYITGNKKMLLSALVNMIINSIQAMGDGGLIEINVIDNNQGEVLISIIDNGPGMSNQVQKQIFNPFFTTRTEGTGLGLAVVAAIASAHDGKVWVESTLGIGSRFVLCLPKKSMRRITSNRCYDSSRSPQKNYIEII